MLLSRSIDVEWVPEERTAIQSDSNCENSLNHVYTLFVSKYKASDILG